MNYRKNSKAFYEQYAQEFRDAFAKCKQPVRVGFTFVRNSKHKFDYINPAQTVQDDMVNYDWITDDNADVIIPVFIEYVYDKTNPGVYIELLNCDNIEYFSLDE